MIPTASLARHARGASNWEDVWDGIDGYFKHKLKHQGLDDPLLWAGVRGGRDQVLLMATALDLVSSDAEKLTTEIDWLMALQSASRPAGELWTSGLPATRNEQLYLEAASAAKKAKTAETESLLHKLAASQALKKPAEWTRRSYRRAGEGGGRSRPG